MDEQPNQPQSQEQPVNPQPEFQPEQPQPKNKNIWAYLLIGLVIAGGAFGFYIWQNQENQPKEPVD